MGASYVVAIPSFGRAGMVRPARVFPDALVYVPESQVAQYEKAQPALTYVPVPDAHDGNAARKRNYVLTEAATRAADVLMVDDDVTGVGMWWGGKLYRLSAREATTLVSDGFRMAREARAPLWGINIIADKRAYSVFRPFQLLAPILGPFTGHVLPHGLAYDERMGAKEDYDFWLQAIHRYRRTLRFQQWHYMKREGERGGWHGQRTAAREWQWCEAIMRKWGRRVIKYDATQKSLLDARVEIPINGC